MNEHDEAAAAIETLVRCAQAGDVAAFEKLVRRFQDRATAYAAYLLRDAQCAEDAAQEAFLEAFRFLPRLREPSQFPVWLRKIVFKQCDRIMRGPKIVTLPLEKAALVAAPSRLSDPAEIVARRQAQAAVRQAIDALPDAERAVTLLFYQSDMSLREVAAFLDVPLTTVKNRLHQARWHLKEKEQVIRMVQDTLQEQRPSRDADFIARVQADITRVLAERAGGDLQESALRERYPDARYRDPHPVFQLTGALLRWAVVTGASEIHLEPQAGKKPIASVIFHRDGVKEKVATMPREVHEAVTARFKDGAGLMNTAEKQEGHMPVRCDAQLYDAAVSFFSSPRGVRVIVRLFPVPG